MSSRKIQNRTGQKNDNLKQKNVNKQHSRHRIFEYYKGTLNDGEKGSIIALGQLRESCILSWSIEMEFSGRKSWIFQVCVVKNGIESNLQTHNMKYLLRMKIICLEGGIEIFATCGYLKLIISDRLLAQKFFIF